ncbi:MAG: DUF4129 domain-containing protein [Chloroflexi bacterium]|nr:DUF4129 domain-containing protein [Chloroflexota bacterium]
MRRGVLGLLFTLVEGCLVSPLLLMIPSPLQPLSPAMALGMACVVIGAIAGTRHNLATHDASLFVRRVVLGAWLIGPLCICVLFAVSQWGAAALDASTVIGLFICAGLLWWRGVVLGLAELTPAEARQRFRNGLVLFGAYALVTLLVPAFDVLPFLLPFLLGTLLALPLSYLERVEQSAAGQHVAMTWRWWRSILLSVSLALALSGGVMALFTPDILNRALILLLGLILLPLILVGPLVDTLAALLRSLLNPQVDDPGATTALEALRRLLRQSEPTRNPLPIDDQVVTTTRTRRRPLRVRKAGEEDGTVELATAQPPPIHVETLADRFNLRRWLAGISIRRLYACMAREAFRRGFPRQLAQTPDDYLPQLNSAFPGASVEVRLITDAYVAAHYGEVPDTVEKLARIRAAWERTRATRCDAPVHRGTDPQA